jgi:hypothetical protein
MEFAGVLVGLIREPIQYRVQPVRGPGLPGSVTVAGPSIDIEHVYAPPSPSNISIARVAPDDRLAFDAQGGVWQRFETNWAIGGHPRRHEGEDEFALHVGTRTRWRAGRRAVVPGVRHSARVFSVFWRSPVPHQGFTEDEPGSELPPDCERPKSLAGSP